MIDWFLATTTQPNWVLLTFVALPGMMLVGVQFLAVYCDRQLEKAVAFYREAVAIHRDVEAVLASHSKEGEQG